MCQRLVKVIREYEILQRDMAKAMGISSTATCLLVNKGQLPARNVEPLLDKLQTFLTVSGCPAEEAAAVRRNLQYEEESMIIRKQTLPPATRQHFRLLRNPFGDPSSTEDIYLSPETRYVREAMHDAAVNGNFLAVVGESGSGKSTLRDELLARLEAEQEKVVVIEPYVLGMVTNSSMGLPLNAEHLAAAIIATVEPGAKAPCHRDARSRKMHQVLRDSSRSGFKHVLLIEEAHDLPRLLLKCLKRFWELKDGQQRLLSIILLGQTELEVNLSSKQADIREVVQRCDTVTLLPIKDCAEFLKHRFARIGADINAIFDGEALATLHERLVRGRDRFGRGVYMGYPLAISNLAMACMNEAAKLGERVVTADVVRQVQA